MDEIKQKILTLTKKKMKESGEYGREAFRGFIEESIEHYLEKGELTEEDDLDAIQEELMELYSEVENEEVEEPEIGDEEDAEREEKNEEVKEDE
jgi:hypothetical protein